MPRNDINIYLRAEAREALTQLTERWGVSRQEAIVRALIIAEKAPTEPLGSGNTFDAHPSYEEMAK